MWCEEVGLFLCIGIRQYGWLNENPVQFELADEGDCPFNFTGRNESFIATLICFSV